MFQCTACYVEDFHKTKLIEHNTCGNISPEFEYVDDFCPDCNEKIKSGIDYKIINNMFMCSSCLEKFFKPLLNIRCNKCQNLFNVG